MAISLPTDATISVGVGGICVAVGGISVVLVPTWMSELVVGSRLCGFWRVSSRRRGVRVAVGGIGVGVGSGVAVSVGSGVFVAEVRAYSLT